MGAIQRLKSSLQKYQIAEDITAQIFDGYINISDKTKKEKKAVFFCKPLSGWNCYWIVNFVTTYETPVRVPHADGG